jgi:peptidoglycan/LPS O-acetylase OafA/YrhL
MRGVLAMVVVYGHVHGSWFYQRTDAPGQLSVMAFFFLSGYVLTRAWNGDYLILLVRRFIRLWPLFAICLAVGALLRHDWPPWTYFFWYPFAYDARVFPVLQSDPPAWSLYIEAWAMIFMPLIVWCGRSTIRTAAAIAISVQFWRFNIVAMEAPLFVAGAYFSGCRFDLGILNGRIVQWLGKMSYSLYLTHWMTLHLCERWLPAAAWLEIPAALVVAQIAYVLVDRPSISASRWIAKASIQAKAAVLGAVRRSAMRECDPFANQTSGPA